MEARYFLQKGIKKYEQDGSISTTWEDMPDYNNGNLGHRYIENVLHWVRNVPQEPYTWNMHIRIVKRERVITTVETVIG